MRLHLLWSILRPEARCELGRQNDLVSIAMLLHPLADPCLALSSVDFSLQQASKT